MSRTKDEQFIIAAYEAAVKIGEPDSILNRYEIGRLVGISEKAVDAICKQLTRANFIKRDGDAEIHLTNNGKDLAMRLLGE
jgi:Mn-dependent DtxR family transcriptional regulator